MTKDLAIMGWKCKDRYLATIRQSSRILSFPDSRKRLITLTNWQWEVFDKLQIEKGWHKREFENTVYRVAIKHYPNQEQDFENFLRKGISYLIKINMAYVMKQEGDWSVINDEH